jgi:hypothetical protein
MAERVSNFPMDYQLVVFFIYIMGLRPCRRRIVQRPYETMRAALESKREFDKALTDSLTRLRLPYRLRLLAMTRVPRVSLRPKRSNVVKTFENNEVGPS